MTSRQKLHIKANDNEMSAELRCLFLKMVSENLKAVGLTELFAMKRKINTDLTAIEAL